MHPFTASDINFLFQASFQTKMTDSPTLAFTYFNQRAKKVVSDSSGLRVDFAIGLVHFAPNLPHGEVKLIEEFKLQKNCEINLLIEMFFKAS